MPKRLVRVLGVHDWYNAGAVLIFSKLHEYQTSGRTLILFVRGSTIASYLQTNSGIVVESGDCVILGKSAPYII